MVQGTNLFPKDPPDIKKENGQESVFTTKPERIFSSNKIEENVSLTILILVVWTR